MSEWSARIDREPSTPEPLMTTTPWIILTLGMILAVLIIILIIWNHGGE